MADAFARGILRIVVAQICQNMGWHAVHTTPLELLVDILHRYLEELGKTTHRYSEQFGRTEPNLDDVALAFKDIGIPTCELEDFVNNVEPVSFAHEIPKFPLSRPNNFQFPKPDSRDVHTRLECIHEHLPSMYPEPEDEEYTSSPTTIVDGIARKESVTNGSENGMLGESPRLGMKRPLDIEALMQTPKRARIYAEDEGRPMREVTSVFMTPAGVISPAREGRLPDARTPSKLADDSCPSSPVSATDNSSESKKEMKKDGKKDVKKDEKKCKERKDKKELKKKSGKKEKDKKENKENKKKDKSKLKSKLLKVGKDSKMKSSSSSSLIARIGSLGKVSDKVKVKSISSKSKLPKQRQNKLKAFFPKSKHKEEKYAEFTKFLKVKTKKKPIKTTFNLAKTLGDSLKLPKSPKSIKSSQAKASKSEKSLSTQIKTLVIKPPVKEKEVSIPPSTPEPTEIKVKSPIKVEPFQHLSGEDSLERLVIDDNPEVLEQQERESRMAALNESIDAAIQRGLEETEKQREESSRSYHETIEDVIRQGIAESQTKTEPRDVYDFTDDELSPPATPVTPRTPDVSSSPVKKKTKKESPESGRKVKDKIKEKIKQKSKDSKTKTKSPMSTGKVVKTEPVDEVEEPPLKASESSSVSSEQEPSVSFQTPFPRLPGINHFSHIPYFSQIPQIPPALLPYPPPTIPPLPSQFQSLTPPNMPMPPVGFYVRNPRPDSGNLTGSPPAVISSVSNGADKAEEMAASKVKQEKNDEIEKVKAKEHKKEKKEKDRGKEKDGEKDSEKEKGKTKKKKERGREKERKKSTEAEKDKSKVKGKDKEKATKSKDKPKEKDKAKTEKKEKKKKEEKQNKEEKDVAGSPNSSSGIPKITFKLGNASATEGTKIVLKLKVPKVSSSSSSFAYAPPSSPLCFSPPPATPTLSPSSATSQESNSFIINNNPTSFSVDDEMDHDKETIAFPETMFLTNPSGGSQKVSRESDASNPSALSETHLQWNGTSGDDSNHEGDDYFCKDQWNEYEDNEAKILPSTPEKRNMEDLDFCWTKDDYIPTSPSLPSPSACTSTASPTCLLPSCSNKSVIKSVMPREGSQSSRSSSPVKETSPPPTPSAKSHPKPQSKVNPVPPAPKSTASGSAPTRTVITETVGTIIDEQGNKIWICPACTRPDDGSPMIGCDECDDWYHWVCVGIVVPPKEEENWFCARCIAKKQSVQKKKKKKHRKDKAQT